MKERPVSFPVTFGRRKWMTEGKHCAKDRSLADCSWCTLQEDVTVSSSLEMP